MRLKLYRAPSIGQAMARVRAELGAEALILATRRVGDGIEITAALEPDAADAPPTLPNATTSAALEFHRVPATLRAALEAGELQAALARTLRFGELPLREKPLLMVGTPGAGKTLTVARLATRLVMTGIVPMVVTADDQRAGATEQLAAFTRLLGISLLVACQPVTLARAVARRDGGAPVLIDTAGCNPFAAEQTEELAALAATAGAATVAVIAAGLDPAEAADQAGAFAATGAGLMVATKLDLARRLGGVLAAAGRGLMLTEGGVSANAADGLQPITPMWLAARLLRGPHA